MKRKYLAPIAKMVDFNYDEQVVASSITCNNYTLVGKENPTTCYDEEKDKPMVKMVIIGCTLYLDNYQ